MTQTVALVKCREYNFDDVLASIKNIMTLVPPPDVKGKTVLLKPNILYPKKPEDCVCTHPIVVAAAVRAFVDLGATVIVGESPAVAPSTTAAKATGMFDLIYKNGGTWVDFHGKCNVPCPNGKIVKQLEFATAFKKADVIVSIAKLKSHQLMAYTGAMKNLFGLIVGLEKAQSHYRFQKKSDFAAFLTDINLAAKPQYAIMDAIIGMDGPGGPGSGDPVKLGFLAASDNILALDWKCAELVGYNPHKIVNLQDALERGVWLKSENQIKTVGVNQDEVRSNEFKIVTDAGERLRIPHWLDSFLTKILVRTPHFNYKKCAKCARCFQICPAHIIQMNGKNKTATLTNKNKCLHCFCCHEICPEKAIKLRRF